MEKYPLSLLFLSLFMSFLLLPFIYSNSNRNKNEKVMEILSLILFLDG